MQHERWLSRHAYNVARYVAAGAVEAALKRDDLRERVIEHKRIFFRSAWAHYETAKPGSFRLVPADVATSRVAQGLSIKPSCVSHSRPTSREMEG